MFSRRTGWTRDLNALTRRLESLRSEGRPPVDLTVTNPSAVGLEFPFQSIAAALTSREAAGYAPDPRGDRTARQAIASWLSGRGPAISPDHLVLTASTSEAYAWLLKLLCEPGDEIVVPRPSYPLFEYLLALESVTPRHYDLRFDGEWNVFPEDVAAAATERTRAVLVVNPANPTGAFLDIGAREALWDWCAARGCALVSDEVFQDYARPAARPNRVVRAASPEARALTFSLSGLSKIAALPQLKLGWIAVAGPPVLRDEALDRLELIADTYLSVNTPAQVAVPEILRLAPEVQERIRQRVRHNQELLASIHRPEAPWTILPSEGGWMAVVRIPARISEEEVCLASLEEGVIVHPGFFFDFPQGAFVVLSLLPQPDVFRLGAIRLGRVLDSI
jgi:aspartate/methionine/tyrosine aminotransferase